MHPALQPDLFMEYLERPSRHGSCRALVIQHFIPIHINSGAFVQLWHRAVRAA